MGLGPFDLTDVKWAFLRLPSYAVLRTSAVRKGSLDESVFGC
jgi:hypothetical protein